MTHTRIKSWIGGVTRQSFDAAIWLEKAGFIAAIAITALCLLFALLSLLILEPPESLVGAAAFGIGSATLVVIGFLGNRSPRKLRIHLRGDGNRRGGIPPAKRGTMVVMADMSLSALGFPDDWDATIELISRANPPGFDVPGHYRFISAYVDPSGVAVGLMDTEGGFSTESFTVHGVGGHRVKAWQVIPGTAEIEVLDDDGTLTKILAFVDDPHRYPWYPTKAVGERA